MNFITNFVMLMKFDESRCSQINFMNLGFSRLYYHYGFVDKLCTFINPKILIN
jgi:5-methylcytosine-specific restriction endonuclease McrBC regulatory subunit McrC